MKNTSGGTRLDFKIEKDEKILRLNLTLCKMYYSKYDAS